MKILIKLFIIWLLTNSTSLTDEIKIFDFTDTELSKLEVRKVRGAKNKNTKVKMKLTLILQANTQKNLYTMV